MIYRDMLRQIMYKDTARVQRRIRVTDGNVDDFAWREVAADIPCALHQYGKQLYAHRDDHAQKLTTDLRLCCDPDVDIRTNDHVTVNH